MSRKKTAVYVEEDLLHAEGFGRPHRQEGARGLRGSMGVLRDYRGMAIRLTDERLRHILERPESVVRSVSDEQAHLYYRLHPDTSVGEKFLCVVVKVIEEDAFVLTAYLTDRIKRGETLWSSEREGP